MAKFPPESIQVEFGYIAMGLVYILTLREQAMKK